MRETPDLLSATFFALADPTRRAILSRLANGPATVQELSAPFEMSGPAVSKHLRVLERAGLVARGREAQWRPRTLQAAPLKAVAEYAEGFRPFWDASFARLDQYLETSNRRSRAMPIPNDVGVTDFSTPSETEIRVVRVFAAPRETLWAMHTDPKHIPNWLTGPEGWTMPVCEVDVRPGGRWRYVWRKAKGEEMGMEGGFVEVVKPSRLVTTERWGPEWPETVNIVEFTTLGDRAVLTMTVRYPTKAARDAALETGMKTGMNESYARLDALVARA